MSQALLMRIIALENRVNELEARFDAAFEMEPDESPEEIVEEILQSTQPLDIPFVEETIQAVNTEPEIVEEPEACEPTYWIQHRGFGWYYVYGPGEIKLHEKGLKHDGAQALADDLNERDPEGETAKRVEAEHLAAARSKKEMWDKAKEGDKNFYEIQGYEPGDAVKARDAQRAGAEFEKLK